MPKKKKTITNKLTKTKIKQKTDELKKIKNDFFAKMEKLRKKQDKILKDYITSLEKKQIEKIKKNI